MGCFQDLETASPRRIHPARVVGDAFGQHSAPLPEPLPNKLAIPIFEMFDDHEQHNRECTPRCPHVQLTPVPLRMRVSPLTSPFEWVFAGRVARLLRCTEACADKIPAWIPS